MVREGSDMARPTQKHEAEKSVPLTHIKYKLTQFDSSKLYTDK
jgi:hypothetical protein